MSATAPFAPVAVPAGTRTITARVVIKGDDFHARVELAARNMPASDFDDADGKTCATVIADIAALNNWYVEDLGLGSRFGAGSLLYFHPIAAS